MRNRTGLATLLTVIILAAIQTTSLYAQWTKVNYPWPSSAGSPLFFPRGNTLFALSEVNPEVWISRSTDNGASWTQVDTGYGPFNFIMTDKDIYFLSREALERSSDDGITWLHQGYYGTPWFNILGLFTSIGENLFAGSTNGVYLSTDEGNSWHRQMNSGIGSDTVVSSLLPKGNNLFEKGNHGIYRSSDFGMNWTLVDSLSGPIGPISLLGATLIVGGQGGLHPSIIESTNDGGTWFKSDSSLSNTYLYSGAFKGAKMFLSTEGGVFASTDNGIKWTHLTAGLPAGSTWAFAISGNNLFLATSSGVYFSTNDGVNWSEVDTTGLPFNTISSISVSGPNLIVAFAVTSGRLYSYGVFSRPLSEITGIRGSNSQMPTKDRLAQNYPNPFNPTTTISYNLAKKTLARLVVFDILGREIATLVDEQKEAGSYSVEWNASHISSGVYFYRLQTGSSIETKKLVVLK